MEKKYIIALLVGIFIYLGAVSGIYLVFKPNIEYRKNQKKKKHEARKNAIEMARKAKELGKQESETPDGAETDESKVISDAKDDSSNGK